jgi:hypothetical protein
MSWTVIEADGNGVRETRRGGTLTGEVEVAAEQKALTAFRDLPPDYTPIYIPPWQDRQKFYAKLLANQKPVAQQEAQPKPEPEPKPKLVTWRLCVRLQPWEVDGDTLYAEWYPSGSIPEHWYPIEAQSQPIETVKRLQEGQKP